MKQGATLTGAADPTTLIPALLAFTAPRVVLRKCSALLATNVQPAQKDQPRANLVLIAVLSGVAAIGAVETARAQRPVKVTAQMAGMVA